jgi:hypothetical protein
MALIQQGQVWMLEVPFIDDPTKSKNRPAMVVGWANLNGDGNPSILIVPITSFGNGGLPISGDVKLNAESIGLRSNGYVRSSRPFTIHPRLLFQSRKPIGTVESDVFLQVRNWINQFLEPQGIASVRD